MGRKAEVWMESSDGSVFSTASPEYHKGCKRIARAEGERRDTDEARAMLRSMFPPGSVVPTVLRHVSSSGMSRRISVLFSEQGAGGPRVRDVSHLVGRAMAGTYKLHERGGLVVGGCGMDMGFSLVYNLSAALWGSGYECLGRDAAGRRLCPSNYHSNHRNTIRCEGVERDGEQKRCYQPSPFGRYPVPEGWPEVVLVRGDDRLGKADGVAVLILAACLTDDNGDPVEVCPTCQGRGELPNPDGPERFDLVHTDGYALRHEWV